MGADSDFRAPIRAGAGQVGREGLVGIDAVDLAQRADAGGGGALQLGVIRDKAGAAGLPDDGLADADLLHVEIQQVAVDVHGRAADHGQIDLELFDHAGGEGADEAAIGAAQDAAGQNDLGLGVGDEDIGDVHVVRHNHEVAVMEQFARHRLGRGADVEEDRGAFGDVLRAGPRDGGFGGGVQAAAFVIADIGDTRGQDRAAVDTFQLARLGQFRQVAADRLHGDAEAFGKAFDSDLALGPGNFEDVGMSESLAHAEKSPLGETIFQKRVARKRRDQGGAGLAPARGYEARARWSGRVGIPDIDRQTGQIDDGWPIELQLDHRVRHGSDLRSGTLVAGEEFDQVAQPTRHGDAARRRLIQPQGDGLIR